MIKPGIYNFEIPRGSTLRKTFIWKPGNVTANLTGYGAKCLFRAGKVLDSTPPLLTLTHSNSGILLGGVQGTITLYATDVAILALPDVVYYGLFLIEPSTDVLACLEGRIDINSSALK